MGTPDKELMSAPSLFTAKALDGPLQPLVKAWTTLNGESIESLAGRLGITSQHLRACLRELHSRGGGRGPSWARVFSQEVAEKFSALTGLSATRFRP